MQLISRLYVSSLLLAFLLPLSSHAADISLLGKPFSLQDRAGYQIELNGKSIGLSSLTSLPVYSSQFDSRWGDSGEFVGVRLMDLLAREGVDEFQSLFMQAGGGYKVTISHTEEGIDTALLAFQLNGDLFSLGGKGPFWLIWPSTAEAVTNNEKIGAVWIWGVEKIIKSR